MHYIETQTEKFWWLWGDKNEGKQDKKQVKKVLKNVDES